MYLCVFLQVVILARQRSGGESEEEDGRRQAGSPDQGQRGRGARQEARRGQRNSRREDYPGHQGRGPGTKIHSHGAKVRGGNGRRHQVHE